MSFNPNQDHSISLAAAAAMTKDYRDANPGALIGGFFGKDALQAILDQVECVGIRYYYALDSNDNPTLVLVGAKANEDDLVNGELADIALPDPPNSSSPNALNS
ncbi:MAG: hypothetical protein KC517_08530 [Bacteroidetes bacterium]|nr:hypothetical protein [Bacteroidota bacterium]